MAPHHNLFCCLMSCSLICGNTTVKLLHNFGCLVVNLIFLSSGASFNTTQPWLDTRFFRQKIGKAKQFPYLFMEMQFQQQAKAKPGRKCSWFFSFGQELQTAPMLHRFGRINSRDFLSWLNHFPQDVSHNWNMRYYFPPLQIERTSYQPMTFLYISGEDPYESIQDFIKILRNHPYESSSGIIFMIWFIS